MLLEEVKMSCFVSKFAWVIPPPVEEIVFPEIVIFVPASNVFFFYSVEYPHIFLKRVCLVNLL